MEERMDNLHKLVADANERSDQLAARLERKVEEVAEIAAKKPKLDMVTLNSREFKSKGNQDQFVFNEKVEETLSSVSKQLDKLETALSQDLPTTLAGVPESITQPINRAKASLQEGAKILLQRQKHIRLADRSDFGWRFVKEYESDQLADNEDDEKRINKAEKAAEKKSSAAKRKKSTVVHTAG
jgi:ABC-type transporter Mla subunit MlaD